MATAKTATLTFRVEPGLKEVLRTGRPAEAPFYRQYGGGADPGLLWAQWHYYYGIACAEYKIG